MSVTHDAASESDTGSTGSASVAQFSWSHGGAASGVRGVAVLTFVNANADDAIGVTYGGVPLVAVPNGRALATSAEPGDCKLWFLGANVPQGTQTVVVFRNNTANVMYAACMTVTAGADTEVFDPNLTQGGTAQAATEEGINNGSNITAVRYAGINSGLGTHPAAGANSTELAFFPATAGLRSITVVRETTAGIGARYVGFTGASDDNASVYFCVREVVTSPFVGIPSNLPGLTFDCLVGMMTPETDDVSSNGTTSVLTTQIMRASNIGPQDRLNTTSAFTLSPASPTGLTKAGLQAGMAPTVLTRVRATGLVSRDAPFKSIRVYHGNNFIYYEQDLSNLVLIQCTMAGPLYIGVPDEGASPELYDYWGFFGQVTGEFCVMQLGFTALQMHLEVNPGGNTTHSDGITITPDTLYWCCFRCDYGVGVARLALYAYPPLPNAGMRKIGEVSVGQTVGGGEFIGHTRQGNGEVGLSTNPPNNIGKSSYFYCGLDWTSNKFPLIPEDFYPPQYDIAPNVMLGLRM